MSNLLSSLKPDSDTPNSQGEGKAEEDHDIRDFINRKQSFNEYNIIDINFQKYQENKPAKGVKNEILNMFNEYKESENKEHARDELNDICE